MCGYLACAYCGRRLASTFCLTCGYIWLCWEPGAWTPPPFESVDLTED